MLSHASAWRARIIVLLSLLAAVLLVKAEPSQAWECGPLVCEQSPAPTSPNGVPPTLIFDVQFPSTMAGGKWLVSTVAGTGSNLTAVTLAAGTVPSNGHLITSIVASTAQNVTGNGVFTIVGTKLIDDTHAYSALAGAGPSIAEFTYGQTFRWTSIATEIVDLYTTKSAANNAACGSACTVGPFVDGDHSHPVPTYHSEDPQEPNSPETPPSEDGDGDSCGTNCGGAAVLPDFLLTDPDSNCSSPVGSGQTNCITTQRNLGLVRAYRGTADKVRGGKLTFQFKSSTQQTWDIGYRTKAGLFHASGSVNIQKSSGVNDTWPVRGDCFFGTANDGPNCNEPYSKPGFEREFGTDEWHWERHVVSGISPNGSEYSYTYEQNALFKYKGGQERRTPYSDYLNYKKPSDIKASGAPYGTPASYLPGATRTTTYSKTERYVKSAGMDITFPESYGNARWLPSMSLSRGSGSSWIVSQTFRSDLGVKYYWYYDNNTNDRWEHWTCEFQGPTAYGCWGNGA